MCPEYTEWRASLKYARTIYDSDYAPDMDQFKQNLIYIAARRLS